MYKHFIEFSIDTIYAVWMSLFNNRFDGTNTEISNAITKQIINEVTLEIKYAGIFCVLHDIVSVIAKWTKLSILLYKI